MLNQGTVQTVGRDCGERMSEHGRVTMHCYRNYVPIESYAIFYAKGQFRCKRYRRICHIKDPPSESS